MNRTLCGLLVALSLAPAAAHQYVSGSGVAPVDDGRGLRLERRWDTLYTEDFERGAGAWRVNNFEGLLTPRFDAAGAHGGQAGFSLTHAGKVTDVAWELTSPPIAVPAGRAVALRLWSRHDQDLTMANGHKDSYWTQLRWLGADGQEVGVTPFDLGPASPAWREVVVPATVPATAKQVVVRFGFDSPNLDPGSYVRLDDVRLLTRAEPERFVPTGELVSRPLHLAGGAERVACRADLPAKTTVALQVRTALDDHGGPGAWSAFGPALTAPGELPASERGRPWLQYRAMLTTADDTVTPTLREVTFAGAGQAGDQRWTGADAAAPELRKLTPGRRSDPSAPLRFSFDDGEGVGLDPRSVAVTLDGQPITDRLTRADDGSYSYQPPQPLKPPVLQPGWTGWQRGNHQGALSIEPVDSREPGRPPALRITREQPEVDTAFGITSPPIPIQPGASYELSVWARNDLDLGKAGAKPGHYASGVTWTDGQGRPVGEFLPLDWGKANDAWHRLSLKATAPAGATFAVVSFGWDAPNLFGGRHLVLAEPDLAGPHPEQPGMLNLHQARLTARDLAGNAVTRDWYILVKEPPKSGIVTVRDDGVVLVDGQPFFPIGMYSVWKRPYNQNNFDVAFRELKAAGQNTAHTYHAERSADFPEFYAKAAEYGFKLFLAARGGSNVREPENVIYDVARECNEPAILAWYLADDTASHISPDELRRVHEAVRDLDPYHLTCQADGVGEGKSRYTAYVDSTDVFLPEVYPIYDAKQPGQVARLVSDMATIQADFAAVGHKRPVWAIVQDFFGWGWGRYPTDAEARAMTYLAIIGGATGMTYYTYGGHDQHKGAEDDPGVWANLKQVTGELATLSPVLCERTPPQAFTLKLSGTTVDSRNHPAVSALLKTHGGKHVLLTASSAEGKTHAVVTAAGLPATVEVLFEGRTVAVKDGAFEDDFAAYGVHVYRW